MRSTLSMALINTLVCPLDKVLDPFYSTRDYLLAPSIRVMSSDDALQYALTTIQQNDYTIRMLIFACGKSIPNLSQLLSSLPSDTITVSYGFCPNTMMYQPPR